MPTSQSHLWKPCGTVYEKVQQIRALPISGPQKSSLTRGHTKTARRRGGQDYPVFSLKWADTSLDQPDPGLLAWPALLSPVPLPGSCRQPCLTFQNAAGLASRIGATAGWLQPGFIGHSRRILANGSLPLGRTSCWPLRPGPTGEHQARLWKQTPWVHHSEAWM